MARPKSFDHREALQAAMAVFWRQGFDATSVQDLTEATGLSRSSLYDTFVDKAGLFEAAAHLYFTLHGERRMQALQQEGDALAALQRFFDLQVAACTHPELPPGCLMTNTATALFSHEPRIVALVEQSTEALRKALRTLVQRGQRQGQIRADVPAARLADMLAGLSFGLNVQARLSRDPAPLKAMAQATLAMLAPVVPPSPTSS